MSVIYDPVVIQEMADSLYRQAATIVLLYTLILSVFCGVGCAVLLSVAVGTEALVPAMGLGCILGALLGYAIGRDRSFHLRVQAQTALCQRNIERHLAELVRQGNTP